MTALGPRAIEQLRRMATSSATSDADFSWEFLEYVLLRLNDPVLWDIWRRRFTPLEDGERLSHRLAWPVPTE